ncbi:MAG: respiratory nitrate reductase subunit gamma, partial [Candidatus Marinimicrobia bacterium]|nr:respiratory nitrate reductase subunit gamma [Candidatus Neomarinimicrobiota bacterium]
MWDNFFFIGLPYITIILFFGGIIYRGFSGMMSGHRSKWDLSVRGDYLWTTRSTGFFGRASIGPASLCMHWGILILFITHVVGLIGGAYNLASWVDFFRWVGL